MTRNLRHTRISVSHTIAYQFSASNSFQVYSKCHEFVREYNGRIHFAQCNTESNLVIEEFPCRELCYQVHKYCLDDIKKFAEIDTCKFYPSVEEYPTCYRPNVTCSKPEAPSHGSVEVHDHLPGSEAKYSCNMLFDLKGNTTRTCQVKNKPAAPCKFQTFIPDILGPTCCE